MTDDSFTFAVANTALIGGIVVFVLVRQFTTRPVTATAYLWIALLVARGLLPPGPAEPTAVGMGFLTVALVASAGFGVWRGATMPMWRDDAGQIMRRGGRVTMVLWLLTVAVRFLLAGVENLVDHAPFNATALWLGMGVTLAAQQVVMARRGHELATTAPTPS